MTTKQEYQESLNRMEEAYYSSDNSMGAMSRFKEDINLITELVNENFKENVETNLEHYKDRIIELCVDELAISKGKVVECCAIPCSECDFEDKNGHCIGNHVILEKILIEGQLLNLKRSGLNKLRLMYKSKSNQSLSKQKMSC